MTRRRLTSTISLSLLMIAACGGDDDKKGADAGVDPVTYDANVDPTFDAAPTFDADVPGACPEFETPGGSITTFPGTFTGDLVGAGADFDIAAGVCTDERDHFAQVGEDMVVELVGLTAGASYLVNIASAGDISFYVATGCSDPSLVGECLLFADSEIGNPETGDFVAPANGSAFIVVDHFGKAIDDGAFTVSVGEAECSEDLDCAGSANGAFCAASFCVPCVESIHCETAVAPVCGIDNTCGAGTADCTGDIDDDLIDNDGPAGATALVSGVASDAAICNSPTSERDFFSITLAETSDLTVAVAFADIKPPHDLDLFVSDSEGNQLGFTFYQNPETVTLSFLPAGDYFIQVQNFGGTDAVALPYTVTATVTDGGDCATATDCAAEFSTQFYRGSCDVGTGACTSIEGASALAEGVACDSGDDCTSGICSNGLAFQSNAQLSVCTIACVATADCAGLAGFSCTVPFAENFCRPDCAANLDCGANVGSENLDTDEPWDYLTCTAGVCDVDP